MHPSDHSTMTEALALLIAFSGLPGTGKTTVAQAVARKLDATYLRVDSIEQAIRHASTDCDIGAAGYAVGNALAESNLLLGKSVVADCVNPLLESRAGWRATADRSSARILEVEVICSDRAEHQRRVEHRRADIPGHVVPSWQEIAGLHYERWTTVRLLIDTALVSPEDAADRVIDATR